MMPGSKQVRKKGQLNPEDCPRASRPRSPGREYGIPQGKKDLLPWSHVTERMALAPVYWVCTVSPDGHPHAAPVDGIWLDDRLYFGGFPSTRRQRNLAANPAVCVHLESGHDVVILHGAAQVLREPGRDLAVRLSEAAQAKYGYGQKPEEYETGENTYVFRPQVAFAWTSQIKDATRWEFPAEG